MSTTFYRLRIDRFILFRQDQCRRRMELKISTTCVYVCVCILRLQISYTIKLEDDNVLYARYPLQGSNSLESQDNSNTHGVSKGSQGQHISSSETSWVVGDEARSSVRELESSRSWLVGSWGESKASSNQWESSSKDHDLVGGRSKILCAHNVVSSTSLSSSSSGLQRQEDKDMLVRILYHQGRNKVIDRTSLIVFPPIDDFIVFQASRSRL